MAMAEESPKVSMSSINALSGSQFPSNPEETIGLSYLGVPLTVHYYGAAEAPLRILLICGQHGDERAVRRALAEFLDHSLPLLLRDCPNLHVAVLAEANPDGAEARHRLNAQGLDLNRDHLLLLTPEVRAIHRFVDHWQPHVVLDLHNFPSRRAHFVKQNLRLGWDICLDYPSHPATSLSAGHPLIDSLMNTMSTALSLENYRFGRYSLLDADGVLRHSTPQLVDLRNVLALRYGVLALLLEARNPVCDETRDQRRHLRMAVASACAQLLRWCSSRETAVRELRVGGGPQPTCPLRYRRRWSPQPVDVPVLDLSTGDPGSLALPRYRCSVQGRRTVELPEAYAVPLTQPALLDVLARQGFRSCSTHPRDWFTVEETRIEQSAQIPLSDENSARPVRRLASRDIHLRKVRYERRLEAFVLFPVDQKGGRCLALTLEMESASALHRHASLEIRTAPGMVYPVVRVIQSGQPWRVDMKGTGDAQS